MGNAASKKSLRDEIGDGYLNLLDSVRHGVEQGAWGRETSGNLANDFYRWIGPAETAPKAIEPAQTGGGVEATPMEGRPSNLSEREGEAVAYARHLQVGPIGTIEMENAHDHEWRDFEAWIDGRPDAAGERGIDADRGRNGPELGE